MIIEEFKEKWRANADKRNEIIDELQAKDYSIVVGWCKYNNDYKAKVFINIEQFEKVWNERRLVRKLFEIIESRY